jgi:hypothetical protein
VTRLGNGAFQFAYTNTSGASFSVYDSTNLVNWDYLGPAYLAHQLLGIASLVSQLRSDARLAFLLSQPNDLVSSGR